MDKIDTCTLSVFQTMGDGMMAKISISYRKKILIRRHDKYTWRVIDKVVGISDERIIGAQPGDKVEFVFPDKTVIEEGQLYHINFVSDAITQTNMLHFIKN